MAINLDDFRRDMDSQNNRNTGFFIPPDGESQIRILPGWDHLFPTKLYKKVGKHTLFGERLICPKETFGQPCPICDQAFALYKSAKKGKAEDKVLAQEIRAIQRFYWNIIVRGKEDKGVLKFECGQKLTEKIINIMLKELNRDITDPQQGHDIIIVKKMNGDFPDYTSSYAVIQPSPLGNDAWLGDLTNFDTEFVCKPYEELRDMVERRMGATVTIAPPATQYGSAGAYAAPAQAPVYTPPPVQTAQAPVYTAPPAQAPVYTPPPVAQPTAVATPSPVQAPVEAVTATPPPAQPVDPNAKPVTAEDILQMLNVQQ